MERDRALITKEFDNKRREINAPLAEREQVMRSQYKVTCPDWGEDDEDPFLVTCFSPDEAVEDWCQYGLKNSWFTMATRTTFF